MKMRILLLPKYNETGPSSRYRFYQFLPVLCKAGFECRISPFFSDRYLTYYYKHGRKDYFSAFLSYFRRLAVVSSGFKYDILIIEYELFPFLPAFFERLFRFFKKKYIVDYDDAIFVNYENSKNRFIRFFLRNKIKTVINHAEAVITGNKYLYEIFSRHNKNTYIIPTSVSYERYNGVLKSKGSDNFIIGWIGSPSSSKYLVPLSDLFRSIVQSGHQLNLIGFDMRLKDCFKDITVNWIEWNQETEIREIKNFSTGIMPLEDDLWSRGKSGFKLIQYMACGLPVIASSIGANKDIVDHGSTGFLANSPEDWKKYLDFLINNREKAQEMGRIGMEKFIKYYSLEALSDKYLKIIYLVLN